MESTRLQLRVAAPTVAAPYPDNTRLSVPGTSRYHLPGCAAVDGKQVERMSLAAHERAGRRPCGLCSP